MAENVPSIRLAGFTEPWEQRKLGDMGTAFGGLTGKSKEDFGHGAAWFVPYTNVFDNPVGDTSRLERVEIDPSQNVVRGGDALFTVSSETPEEVGMSCVWPSDLDNLYLNSFCFGYRQDGTFDPSYLAYMLRADSFRNQVEMLAQGISRFNISKGKVMEIEVPVPDKGEQALIGRFFVDLDNLITLHQREHDRLLNVRSSLIQKMFPKVGETAPSLRFSDYSEPWVAHKLGDLVTRYDQRVPTPTDGYIRLGVRSFARGTFLEKVSADQAIGETELRKVGADNLIVNIVFAWEQAIAITSSEDTVALVSHRFPQFSFNEGQCPGFYRYALLDPRFKHHLWLASPSGAGRNKTLRIDEMLDYELLVPTKAEQRTIAAFFKNLDQSIKTRQCECDALIHAKSALLQKMFV